MKIYKLFITVVIIISIISFLFAGVKREPVEKLAVNSAIGYDLEENIQGLKIRTSTSSRYVLTENEVESINVISRAKNIPETREEAQMRTDNKILLGLEKVYIIGESYGEYGIRDIMDRFFRDIRVRDSAII
jgi:hypothetical protein